MPLRLGIVSFHDATHGKPLPECEAPPLEVGHRNEALLKPRADGLAPVACAKFSKDIAKMGFDRRSRELRFKGQTLSRVALGDPSKDLHFS